MILTTGKFYSQPQYVARIDRGDPLTNGLVSALVFDNQGVVTDRATGVSYATTNAVVKPDAPGKVLYFDGTGDYVDTGVKTVGGVNLFADSTNQWSVVILARLEASGNSGTFIAKCGATGGNRTFHLFRDPGFATKDPSLFLRGTENALDWNYNTADWHQYTVTWDGSTAMAYGDTDKASSASVGSSAQESENIMFGARTSSSPGFPLTGRIAYAYFYNRAISRQESIDLFTNPWQVFNAPDRRIWAAVTSSSHNLVGANSAQANASSAAAITQDQALTGAASAQANAAGTGAITQDGAFVGSPSDQANTSSTDAVTQVHVLSGAASSQANTGGTGVVTLGAVHNLTAAASTQENSGGAAAITQAHVLIHAPSVQDDVASASAIVQTHILAASNGSQVNATSSGAIVLGSVTVTSTVERTAVFRAIVARDAKFQRSKSVSVKFN